MDEEDARGRNDPLAALIKQDLDPLSVAELDTRIAALQEEIRRCEARKKFAASHRSSAEDLFRKK